MKMCSYSCYKNTSTSNDLQELSSILKIVGENNRLRLLCILRNGGEHCVCEFEEHVKDLSQSLISHHLADLKQAGLVIAEKRGLRMHYSLSEQGVRVTNVVFSLITNKAEIMEQTQKSSGGCCGSKIVMVSDELGEKIVTKPCSEFGKCESKNCNRKDNENED